MADASKKKKKPVKMSLAEFQSSSAPAPQEAPRRDAAPSGSSAPAGKILYVWNVNSNVTERDLGGYFERYKLDDVKQLREGVFAVTFATESDLRAAYSLNGSFFRSRLFFGDSADQPPAEYVSRNQRSTADSQREQQGGEAGEQGREREGPPRRDYDRREGGRDGGAFERRSQDGSSFRDRGESGYGRREGGGFRERYDDDGPRERRPPPPPSRSDVSGDWRREARAQSPPRQREDRYSSGGRGFGRGFDRDRDSQGPRRSEGGDREPQRGPPKINLDALRSSLAASAPASDAAAAPPRSTANPFGAARPVDTASKLEKIEAEVAAAKPPREKTASPSRPAAAAATDAASPTTTAAPAAAAAAAAAPAKSTPKREKAPPADTRRQPEPVVRNKFQGLTVEDDEANE